MAYNLTFQDAQDDIGIASISGTCPTTDRFAYLVNAATDLAMRSGNWFGTEHLIRMCVYNQCIAWPRYVGTPLGVRACRHNVDIKNLWYTIVGPAGCCNNGGWSRGLKESGTTPTFASITNRGGSYLRVYAVKREDLGKTIKFFGVDSNNQPLQELDSAGVWQMGMTMTLTAPFIQSTIKVSGIQSVLKPVTQGNVLVYEVDPDLATNIKQLALYAPDETRPSYRRSLFSGLCVRGSNSHAADGSPVQQIEALVKLAYVPVRNPEDFLLIDDLLALKNLIQAVRYNEDGNKAQAKEYELDGIHMLNLRDRDKSPANQHTVVVNPVTPCFYNPI